jgi:hypothetical protein
MSGHWTLQQLVPHAEVERERGGLTLGSAPLNSCFSGSRKSEGTETTLSSVASPHSGHTAAGTGYQQSVHVVF